MTERVIAATQTIPSPANSGQGTTPNGNSNGYHKKTLTTKEAFKDAKRKFSYVGGGVAGASLLAILGGSLKYGITFPSKFLKVASEAFGSIAGLTSPVFLIGNEALNYYARKKGNGTKAEVEKVRKVFDTAREGFYRLASTGFIGFIIEPFVNPEKFGKSIFHKATTIANIPNLLFSSVMWAGGNFQALIAWGLKTKEQLSAHNAKNKDDVAFHNERVDAYDGLYQSFKRQAVIGSINNPTMQGLHQFADGLAFATGKMDKEEFFSKPFLGLSRTVSFFVGLPEWCAKGVDSFVRVVKERENLKAGLPEFIFKPLDNVGKKVDKALSGPAGEKGVLKSIRHLSEMVFHTLSPLSMGSLFALLNDMEGVNEEAQSRGGATAFLDKVFGRTAKTFTLFFNTLYIALGRLPQTVIQSVYFGRKKWGEHKGESEEQTKIALNKLRDRICNNSLVGGISDLAKKCIEYLVPDFYKVEHEQGYLSYEQIQANYAADQAKGTKTYEELQDLAKKFKAEPNDSLIEAAINEKINLLVEKVCMPFVVRDAAQGYQNLDPKQEEKIQIKIIEKIKQRIGILQEPEREALPFIGADFLATNIFKLLDAKSRAHAIDYTSEHHNMTTAYDNDEYRLSFEYELLPVLGECIKALQNTTNRIQGIDVDAAA